jgi:histidinol-phosphatase (PHP family)
MIDYHMHGEFCGHSSGPLEEYVLRALELGLTEIGFSDHLPKVVDPDPYHAMLIDRLPDYVAEVDRLQQKYSDRITILLGIEADYFVGYEEETARLISSQPFDYVIGALHFLGDWHFSSKAHKSRYGVEDPEKVFPEYFGLLSKMIGTGLFDIIAHPDAIKRTGFTPFSSMEWYYRDIASMLEKHDMAIEVNTAGLRRDAGTIYPEEGFLRACARRDIPVTLGSDAHVPEDVARDFGLALELVRRAGVRTTAKFRGRKMLRSSVVELFHFEGRTLVV